jgi:hypothetical protein
LHGVPDLDVEGPVERAIERPLVGVTHVEQQGADAVADAGAIAAGPRGRRTQHAGVAGKTVTVGTREARVAVSVARVSVSIPGIAIAVSGVAVSVSGVAVAISRVSVARVAVSVSVSVAVSVSVSGVTIAVPRVDADVASILEATAARDDDAEKAETDQGGQGTAHRPRLARIAARCDPSPSHSAAINSRA